MICPICKKDKDIQTGYYTYYTRENGSDKHAGTGPIIMKPVHICKSCIRYRFDKDNKESYIWVIKECNIPFVEEEWNRILNRQIERWKETKDYNYIASTLGKYIALMKLNGYRYCDWEDSERLNELRQSLNNL